ALGAGLAEDRDEDAALALLGIDGVRGVGEEEERDSEEMEDGVAGAGLVLVEREMGGGEEPVWAREKAGGDRAVVDVVAAGAGFDGGLAGEEERVGRDEAGLADCVGRSSSHPSGRRTSVGDPGGAMQADGAGDVVEATRAGLEVVGAVGCGKVLVVVAAGEMDVAVGGEVVSVLVVGDRVGAEEVVLVGDLDVAGEEVDAVVPGLG